MTAKRPQYPPEKTGPSYYATEKQRIQWFLERCELLTEELCETKANEANRRKRAPFWLLAYFLSSSGFGFALYSGEPMAALAALIFSMFFGGKLI